MRRAPDRTDVSGRGRCRGHGLEVANAGKVINTQQPSFRPYSLLGLTPSPLRVAGCALLVVFDRPTALLSIFPRQRSTALLDAPPALAANSRLSRPSVDRSGVSTGGAVGHMKLTIVCLPASVRRPCWSHCLHLTLHDAFKAFAISKLAFVTIPLPWRYKLRVTPEGSERFSCVEWNAAAF